MTKGKQENKINFEPQLYEDYIIAVLAVLDQISSIRDGLDDP